MEFEDEAGVWNPLAPEVWNPLAPEVPTGRGKKRSTPSAATQEAGAPTTEPRRVIRRGGKGRGRGSGSSKHCTCFLCLDPSKTTVGNNPYCKDCKPDHEALRTDAKKQNKLDVLTWALQDPELYRKLLLDYRCE